MITLLDKICSLALLYASEKFWWVSFIINPTELNVNADKFNNLVGDNAKFNAEKIINIFKGEDNDFSKAVCLNAAAGLIVNETYQNFADAYNNTREHILSGKTFQHLKKIQNVWKYITKNNR